MVGGSICRRSVVLLAWWLVLPCAAQVPGGVRPDVQVVVLPHPSGQWAVSLVYPKVVARTTMQAHLTRLLSVSGWSANNVVYETRGLQKNNGNFDKVAPGNRLNHENLVPGGRDPAMSSVTFLSRSPVVGFKTGRLPVEPFARAFRDLNRVYVTFFVPPPFTFRGLRSHSDKNIRVALSMQNGAYTYVLTIRNHGPEPLNLPSTEVLPLDAPVRGAAAERPRWRLVATGLVVGLAAFAGLLAYGWARGASGR